MSPLLFSSGVSRAAIPVRQIKRDRRRMDERNENLARLADRSTQPTYFEAGAPIETSERRPDASSNLGLNLKGHRLRSSHNFNPHQEHYNNKLTR
jgi:hypothetical protein